MNVDAIEWGRIDRVYIRPAPIDQFPQSLRKGDEVDLFLGSADGEVFLRSGDSAGNVPVAGTTPKDHGDLVSLLARNLPRISWIADINPQKREQCLLQFHAFPSVVELGSVDIGIDDRTVEEANKKYRRRRARNSDEVAAWLKDECLVPGRDSGTQRVFLSAGREQSTGQESAFLIHGRTIRVYVRRSGDILTVDKLTRSGRAKADAPVTLAVGNIRFVDKTVATETRRRVVGTLEALSNAGRSFVDLWRAYCQIEFDATLDEARRVRQLRYHRWTPVDDRVVRFDIAADEGVKDRLLALQDMRGATVEAGVSAPAVLLSDSLTFEEGREIDSRNSKTDFDEEEKTRPLKRFCGGVERVDVGRRSVYIRAEVDEETEEAPEAGVLYVCLSGNTTQQERRTTAYTRIFSGTAAMPELGLIIEGQHVPAARRTDVQVITPLVRRKVFPTHPPTPRQEEAIGIALTTPDIALIQGPPGTGKTTVLAAILERLNEMGVESPNVSGNFLLTSYQHDAVENAMSRMSINGMPALKFGRRRRRGQSAQDIRRDDEILIESWRTRKVADLRRKVPWAPTALLERDVKTLRDSYVLAPGSMHLTALMLGELETKICHVVPVEVLDRVRDVRDAVFHRLKRQDDIDQNRRMRLIWSLRSEERSFRDDGPLTAQRVLAVCAECLTPVERELIERAAAWTSSDAPSFLRDLAAARLRILSKLKDTEPVGLRPKPRSDVIQALDMALAAVREAANMGQSAKERLIVQFADDLDKDTEGTRRTVQDYAAVFAATCQQCDSKAMKAARSLGTINVEDGDAYDTVVIDEAARANPLDLFIPMVKAKKRIILVGDHRQLPQLIDPEIEKLVVEGRASGDSEDIVRGDLKRSLFERLFTLLGSEGRDEVIQRCVTLDEQYRMHPVLGDFVSQAFYAPHGEGFSSPRPASDFEHGLSGYTKPDGSSIPAAWRDVPHSAGSEERIGTSIVRIAEADWIAKELVRLLESPAGKNMSFGVISFYSAQVEEIIRRLAAHGVYEETEDRGYEVKSDYRRLERQDGTIEERLRVGSVDAFQGKEFDVVFLSMVRSVSRNRRRTNPFGFLAIPNRLCVSMSRQRRMLIVVGDASMLEDELAPTQVKPLIEFFGLCREGQHGQLI